MKYFTKLSFLLILSFSSWAKTPSNLHDTHQLISLNFQSIPLRSVLQLMAEFTGINIIVSKQVQGNITLRLNSIPWDEALETLLKTNALVKRERGNIMFIAPAAELRRQEKGELRSRGEFAQFKPLRSEIIQVNYAKAAELAKLLTDKSNSLLTKRGLLNVDLRTNSIWIQDTEAQILRVKKLIKKLDVPVKQVLIEARIVDVTKDFAKELGIRFGVAKAGPIEGPLIDSASPLAERLNMDFTPAPFLGTPATMGIALAKLGDGILLDLELSALESEGRGEIIASPRLITTNQQAALIQSGEEIPYQESSSSGATSTAFKKAVLSLKVKPQITPDSKILMNLQINQDRPSAQLFNGVPAILTKEIQTNVLVKDGQTIVLGGIYKQDKRSAIRRVPFLGELPVVGGLFRSKHRTIVNEELLIFITPRILNENMPAS